MKIVRENDRGKALCDKCGLVTTTFKLRDVPFDDDSGIAKKILAGVCDKCHAVVSIPHQSTPQIKVEYDKAKRPIEARVPAHFIDTLNLARVKIDKDVSPEFYRSMILYYVHGMYSGHIKSSDLKKLLNSEFAQSISSKRLSIKVNRSKEREFISVVEKAKLENTSDLLKGIIIKIYNDILQKDNSKHLAALKRSAAIF